MDFKSSDSFSILVPLLKYSLIRSNCGPSSPTPILFNTTTKGRSRLPSITVSR